MNHKKSNAAEVVVRFLEPRPAGEAERAEGIEGLVRRAAGGDVRAVGAVAIAYGPVLVEHARAELGRRHEDDAADVVQEFYLGLLDLRMRMPAIRRCAVAWMRRMVGHLAREHVRERGGGEAA